jgi:hypothetical protein
MKVRSLELSKEALDTGQRLKMKVELAIKFSPLGFCPGSATVCADSFNLCVSTKKAADKYCVVLRFEGWILEHG